jgi:hypothetical protein
MRLALNEPITLPRPLFLDGSTGNLRPAETVEYQVDPPGLAYIDPQTLTATGLVAGEGRCLVTASLGGTQLSKTVPVVVPAPQTVEVPGVPPAFVPTELVIPGE